MRGVKVRANAKIDFVSCLEQDGERQDVICRACGDDILATARSIHGDYGKHGIRSLGLGCSACDTGELNAGAGSKGSFKDVDLRAAIKYSAGRMMHELLIKHAAV